MSARTTRWPPPLLAVAVAALLTACGDTVSDAPAFTRSDSAGVEIVQSSGPGWSADDAWTIDSLPRVSIGRLEGDPRYLFGDVMGAVRVGDRIVVADGQALELRFFDLDGIHVQTVGREGDGPGELNSILELWRCAGDEIRVLDFRDQAVLVHAPDGDFVEEVRVLEPSAERSRRPYALACSPNGGGYVGVGWGDGPDEGEEGEVLRAEAPAWLFDDQGDVVLDLGMHLSSERFTRISGSAATIAPHPFGRAVSFALDVERVFEGTGESFEVRVFDREGNLRRLLRGPTEDLSAAETLLDRYRTADLAEQAADLRDLFLDAGAPMPEVVPAFTDLRLAPNGALWAKRFAPPWSGESRWGVFSPDGAFLGHVRLPDGVELADIGPDWVLGISADELGVERVHLYDLR